MNKVSILLLLSLSLSLSAMEEPSPDTLTITIVKEYGMRSSYENDQMISKAFDYFLGKISPQMSRLIGPILRQKVKQSEIDDHELWSTVSQLDPESSLSDSQEVDRKIRELKKLITASIEESLKDRQEQATDAVLQLQMKDKDLKEERYRFWGACAGVIGITITAFVTITSLLLSSECDN